MTTHYTQYGIDDKSKHDHLEQTSRPIVEALGREWSTLEVRHDLTTLSRELETLRDFQVELATKMTCDQVEDQARRTVEEIGRKASIGFHKVHQTETCSILGRRCSLAFRQHSLEPALFPGL